MGETDELLEWLYPENDVVFTLRDGTRVISATRRCEKLKNSIGVDLQFCAEESDDSENRILLEGFNEFIGEFEIKRGD